MSHSKKTDLQVNPTLVTRRRFLKVAGGTVGALLAGMPRGWIGRVYASEGQVCRRSKTVTGKSSRCEEQNQNLVEDERDDIAQK